MIIKKLFCTIFLISLLLTGCSSSTDLASRIKSSASIANQNNFHKELVKANGFVLTTYQRITNKNLPFVFYIEGDGHISEGRYAISDNPTPVNPMLLKLATLDNRPNVVYIARPCQYTPLELNPKCINDYWLDKRMGQEVVDSINYAINYINNEQKFSLIGFSGGGGLVVTIAAQNSNVKDIITIAGNLDIVGFNNHHNNRGYLSESLNPIDYAKQINNIPQLHLSGGNDKIVPPFIALKYVKTSASDYVKQKVILEASHSKGWDKIWPNIWHSLRAVDSTLK
jgi:hypothetical protein